MLAPTFCSKNASSTLVNDIMLLSISVIVFETIIDEDKSSSESVRTMRGEALASNIFFVIPKVSALARGQHNQSVLWNNIGGFVCFPFFSEPGDTLEHATGRGVPKCSIARPQSDRWCTHVDE